MSDRYGGRYSAGRDGTEYGQSVSWTRRKVFGSISAGVLALIVALVLLIGGISAMISVGGFLANHANEVGNSVALKQAKRQAPLIKQSAENQNQAAQDNQGTQYSLVQQISSYIGQAAQDEIDKSGSPDPGSLQSRAVYIAGQACMLQGQLLPTTTLPQGMAGWFHRNCSSGGISPSSPILQGQTG